MDSRNPGQAASSRLAGSRVARGAILVVLFSLLPLQYAKGHDPGLSSLTIRQRTNGLEATLTLAVRDAAQLAELDEDHDGIVTQAEFAQTRSQLETADQTEAESHHSPRCWNVAAQKVLDANKNDGSGDQWFHYMASALLRLCVR